MTINRAIQLLTFLLLVSSIPTKAQQKVNVDNFVQAETYRFFKAKVDKGAIGKLQHNRAVISVDNQYIKRMNRDTRYSSGIFDLTEPVTIIKPNTGDRYLSMTVTNENNYIKKVIYEPGEYTFTKEEIGTRYAQITFRTFVNASSAEDNKIVTAIQDQIIVKQKSAGEFELADWDKTSLDRTRGYILNFVKDMPNSKKMFGDEQEVSPIRHLIGTAAGFGGIAEKDAMYLNVFPENNDGKTGYVLKVPKAVPVDAFWSITVYNDKGYLQKNDYNSYSFNNITAKKNKDGSITIHLGGDAKQLNYIPISVGWSYNIRMYRPQQEILDGTWTFPKVQLAE